jgi:hypothetical protein
MEWLLRTWDDVGEIGVNPGVDALVGLHSLLFLPLGPTLRLELAFLLFGQLSLPLLMCLRAWFRQGSPFRLNRIKTT